MEHELTTKDTGSHCASADVDQEICQQIEARLQRRLRASSWWYALVPLFIVIVLVYVFGVPEIVRGWINEWLTPAEQLRRQEEEAFIRSFLATGTGASATAESVVPYLVFLVGFPLVLFLSFTVFWHRWQSTRLMRGVRRNGLFACPRCGGDTRMDSQSCSLCAEIDSATVPAFWREYVLDDPDFHRFGIPSVGRIKLFERFPASLSRSLRKRRLGYVWLGASTIVLMIAFLWKLMFGPGAGSLGLALFYVFVWAAMIGFFIGSAILARSCNRFSEDGFCRTCKYERSPGSSSGSCQECGEEVTDGTVIFAYRKPAPWDGWLWHVPLAVWVIFWLLGVF